jgi:hypothetical protein
VNNNSAVDVAQVVERSGPLRALARLGFAINGLTHILIAAIALAVAVGAGGGSADQSGALSGLAASPGGVFVLWTVVIGLVSLGAWLVLSAFLFRTADPKRKWSRGIVEIGKAAVYFILAATAFTFASGGSTSSANSAGDVSAQLLISPGGMVVLTLIGLGVLVIAVYFVRKGALKKFTSDISVPHGPIGRAIVIIGVVGYVAKGVALGVMGALIVLAVVTVDPTESTGLDGALRSLVSLPYGGFILATISIGLIAYGLYCFVRALRARL